MANNILSPWDTDFYLRNGYIHTSIFLPGLGTHVYRDTQSNVILEMDMLAGGSGQLVSFLYHTRISHCSSLIRGGLIARRD